MNSESILVWLLRSITAIAVLVPLAFYYFTSGSAWNFIMPSLDIPSNLMYFNPNSLRITSVDYSAIGNTYILSLRAYNTGSMSIGLKEFDGIISVSSLNMRIRFVIQSSFILEPGEEERVSVLLENGSLEDFLVLYSQKPPVDISGKATLILHSAELPLNFSITNLPISSLLGGD